MLCSFSRRSDVSVKVSGGREDLNWTDERVALLRQLWGEGKTAAEIARALGGGVTRNAVIGKAHRLKLSNRVSPIQQNDNTRKPVVVASSPPPERRVVARGEGVRMADLKERMCRWPLGDPKDTDFRCCGEVSVPGMPYCPEHARMAYQTATKARTLNAEDFEDGKEREAEEIEVNRAASG